MKPLFEMKNLFEEMTNHAVFSEDRKHRFILYRSWDLLKPRIAFIGLNPSTANENRNDPTIRRVVNFANTLGFGVVYMVNLFTYVTSNPKELQTCENPLLQADEYLIEAAALSDLIVFAWGRFPEARERAEYIIKQFPQAYCLGKNKDGSPKHPLYVPGNTKLIPFKNE